MNDPSSAEDADNEWEAHEAELDDIMNWWAGFGFQGFGRLAQDAPARARVKNERRTRKTRVPKISKLATTKKIVVEPEAESNRDDGSESTYVGNADLGTAMDGLELDMRAVKIEDTEKPQEGIESLPSSLMVDPDPPGNKRNEEITVPMRSNLGHDLGDFLKWETAHVQSM